MSRIHCLGVQFKKAMLKDLIKQQHANPCQQLVDKILSLTNPGKKRKRNNWSRTISNVIPAVRNQHGQISNNHKDIFEAAEMHVGTLFANHDACSLDDIKSFLNQSNSSKITEEESRSMVEPFSID